VHACGGRAGVENRQAILAMVMMVAQVVMLMLALVTTAMLLLLLLMMTGTTALSSSARMWVIAVPPSPGHARRVRFVALEKGACERLVAAPRHRRLSHYVTVLIQTRF
jgi:hypothetical protein